MVNVSEAPDIDKILENSGFNESAQGTIIAADGFKIYNDILTVVDADIVNLAKGFYDGTVASGKISFGLRRTNPLKVTHHWYQDFRRISWTPSLIGIINDAEFCAAIEAVRKRARIRKHSLEESTSLRKDDDIDNLKCQKDCITWSRALKNYLSNILGQYRFLLSYVIR